MSALDTIEVDITVELGSATLPIHHVLRLGRGAVIELDTSETDPLRIYANGIMVAHGAVKIDDGKLKVEVTEKVLRRG